MNEDLDEALSAWIDGEVPPTEVLRRALARPGALAMLDELLAVRELMRTDAEPRSEAILSTREAMASTRKLRRHLAPQLRWALAAVVLLAVGVTLGVSVARRDTPAEETTERPPAADLIAPFPFERPSS